MKRYAKLVQADKRGQIVIPKDVRDALGMDEETGFFVYVIPEHGILLKQVAAPDLEKDPATTMLRAHADQLGIPVEALKKTVESYKKDNGGLQDL